MNTSYVTIKLDDICLEVIYKNIKNIYLRIHSPHGKLTISAPRHMSMETIRNFSITKLGWIRKQQGKLKKQNQEIPKEYISGESHCYLGKRYLLKVIEQNTTPTVILHNDVISLYLRKGASIKKRETILQNWYEQKLHALIPKYVVKLEKIMNVKVNELYFRTMKTRWGSCNPKAKRIWLNLELAKKKIECIEYVLVHEMVHLLEPNHNKRFFAFMDIFLPSWKKLREELNWHT